MAEYLFNLAHATSYAFLTSWCAWAKYYFPAYFLAGAMTSETLGDGKELPSLIQDCRALKVKVARPDINQSQRHYHAIDPQSIRIGFRGIHGIGEAAIGGILKAREDGPFISRDDVRARVKPREANVTAVMALEESGAFDLIDGRQRRINVDTLLEELHLFGYFLSGHPCERLRPFWLQTEPHLKTIAEVFANRITVLVQKYTPQGTKRVEEYPPTLIAGIVTRYHCKKSKSKAGSILHFFDLEDETGVAKIFLTQKKFDQLGLLSISKGMGFVILGSKSTQPSRAGDIIPVAIRSVSLTQ